MPDRELLVRIVGDDRDLQRALGNTDRRLQQIDQRTATFGRNVGRAFAAAGIAIGTAEVFRLAGDAVEAASALNEEVSKSQQIFGASSDAIVDWSETTAQSMGISQRAALEATGIFGNLFRVIDVAPEQAGEMSRSLVQLAADLSSFNNADPTEVLNAIRSGLIGEAEPLRRYGVLLSEARVQQVAMAQTGKDNAKELTNQEKALARYQIILRDTAPAQGDFARTSDSLANQARILRANLDDLSANIGSVLIPVLTDATDAANLLFIALDKFRGIDFSPGFDFPDPPDWLVSGLTVAPVSPLAGVALGIKKALEDDAEEIERAVGPVRSERGAEAIDGLREQAEERAERARDASRAVVRANRLFRAFVKSMGLKLDRAGLTAGLDDDVAVLRELESAILRAIEREGRTFELVDRLVQTRLQISGLLQQQADDAKQAGEDAFNTTVDALSLNLDLARATKSLADDQAALRAIEQAILRRISQEGETTDLMRQLFNVRQEQAEIARQLAEQRRDARKARQFEALGLTPEGEERTPGIGSLRRRGRNLIEELKDSGLDESQINAFVKRISVIFTDQFDTAGKEIRQAILDMFRTINQALDQGDKDSGRQITPGGIRPLQRLVAGANLTAEQLAILQKNMQRRRQGRPVNAFGVDFDSGTFSTASLKAGGPGITIEPQDVNIYLDGEKISNVVVKHMQKTGKRRTNRRGGAGAGRGAIL